MPRLHLRIAAPWLVLSLTAAGLSAQVQQPSVLLGADISALGAPGRFGRPPRTYQDNGTPADELTILRSHGWNAFRLRVFVSPVREAPDNSLENTIPLARHRRRTWITTSSPRASTPSGATARSSSCGRP